VSDAAKQLSDELVELLTRCKVHDALQARTLIECAIAILDRNKLAEGLPLASRAEFEGFARMVFVTLRTRTGNANPPAGGIQA
jgi:hypothetical protein